jgi:peptidoglycan hydrolase-like protein with peptidoglycan-binding domain
MMLLGIDYASVDDNGPPDWTRAKQPSADGSRLTFVIIRGAYGNWPDTVFMRDWAGVKAAGLVRGPYLYPRYKNGQGVLMPIASQIAALEHAIEKGGGLIPNHDLPPALDIESSGSPTAFGCSPEEALDWYREFWNAMHAAFGVIPMIYTSGRVWLEDLHNQMAPDLATSPAWLAKPWPWKTKTTAHRDISKAFSGGAYDPQVPIPWGGGNWWMHQYQGDALNFPGFNRAVDISRFNVMKLGEKGARVEWVQHRVGATPDGDFGPKTDAAIKTFQTKHGLTARSRRCAGRRRRPDQRSNARRLLTATAQHP